MRILNIMLWTFRITSYMLLSLVLLCVAAGATIYMLILMNTMELPNGMIVKWEFDSSDLLEGRHDLYAADGRTLLASGITHICFDDRYVDVIPHGTFGAGSIEALPGTRHPDEEPFSMPPCNGYFVYSLPPKWLYSYSPGMNNDGWDVCADRNFDNPSLKSAKWLVGPCAGVERSARKRGCSIETGPVPCGH